MASSYDLMVIGGGPGGVVGAIRASQHGMRTAVVEEEALGGICLHWGCMPTKALLKSAEVYESARNASKYGVSCSEVTGDLEKMIERSRQMVKRLATGGKQSLKKYNIDLFQGKGRILSPGIVGITEESGQEKEFSARHILIATGARPRDLPGVQRDGQGVIGSREALALTELPERLVVIGGGAIGVEFAYFYRVLGSEVTVLEMRDEILPEADHEMAAAIRRSFEKRGITVEVSARVESVERLGAGARVVYTKNGDRNEMEADKVLVAVGVVGNVEGLGLESAGVKILGDRIEVDNAYRTAVPTIWAVGDVVGPPWLAHVASAEATRAVHCMTGQKSAPIDYTAVPVCVYCRPQLASVGLTERQAKETGRSVSIGKYPFQASGHALMTGETQGLVKLLFDSEEGQLLGAHLVGHEATEMIAELVLAKRMNATLEQFTDNIYAHPTLTEAIQRAASNAERDRK